MKPIAETTLPDYLATRAYLGGQADDVLAVITGDTVRFYQRKSQIETLNNRLMRAYVNRIYW